MAGRMVLRFVVVGALFAGAFGARTLTAAKAAEPGVKSFTVYPIGRVHKRDATTTIEISPKYRDGLLGLDGFSHVWVFYWFDRHDTPMQRSILRVHPLRNERNPLTGVFATRAPVRPNLIALSLCRVRAVNGATLEIDEIDAFDGTPVIDLKPYTPGPDRAENVKVPAWAGLR